MFHLDRFTDLRELGEFKGGRDERWGMRIAMSRVRVVPFDPVAAKCSTIFDDLQLGAYVSCGSYCHSRAGNDHSNRMDIGLVFTFFALASTHTLCRSQ